MSMTSAALMTSLSGLAPHRRRLRVGHRDGLDAENFLSAAELGDIERAVESEDIAAVGGQVQRGRVAA